MQLRFRLHQLGDLAERFAETLDLAPQIAQDAILADLKLRVATRRPDSLIVATKCLGLLPRAFTRGQVVQLRLLHFVLGVAGVAEGMVQCVKQVGDGLSLVDLSRKKRVPGRQRAAHWVGLTNVHHQSVKTFLEGLKVQEALLSPLLKPVKSGVDVMVFLDSP